MARALPSMLAFALVGAFGFWAASIVNWAPPVIQTACKEMPVVHDFSRAFGRPEGSLPSREMTDALCDVVRVARQSRI